jgi:hypothetical protein
MPDYAWPDAQHRTLIGARASLALMLALKFLGRRTTPMTSIVPACFMARGCIVVMRAGFPIFRIQKSLPGDYTSQLWFVRPPWIEMQPQFS